MSSAGESQISDPKVRVFHACLVAHSRISMQMEEYLARANTLPIRDYDVLVTLEMAENSTLRMNELAERVVYSRSGLTRLVDRLAAEGLVRRQKCGRDRRGIYCILTDEGRAAREAAGPFMLHAIHHVFGQHFSAKEVETLLAMMLRVHAATENPIPLP